MCWGGVDWFGGGPRPRGGVGCGGGEVVVDIVVGYGCVVWYSRGLDTRQVILSGG